MHFPAIKRVFYQPFSCTEITAVGNYSSFIEILSVICQIGTTLFRKKIKNSGRDVPCLSLINFSEQAKFSDSKGALALRSVSGRKIWIGDRASRRCLQILALPNGANQLRACL